MPFYIHPRKCPGATRVSCGKPASFEVLRSVSDSRGVYCAQCAKRKAKDLTESEKAERARSLSSGQGGA